MTSAQARATLDQRGAAVMLIDRTLPDLHGRLEQSVQSARNAQDLLILLLQCDAASAAAQKRAKNPFFVSMGTARLMRLYSTPMPPPKSWCMATTVPASDKMGAFLRSARVDMRVDGFMGLPAARKAMRGWDRFRTSEISITAIGSGKNAQIAFRKTGAAHVQMVTKYESDRDASLQLRSALELVPGAPEAAAQQGGVAAVAAGALAAGAAAPLLPASAICGPGVLQKRPSNTKPDAAPPLKRAHAGPPAAAAPAAHDVITID